MIDDLLLQAQEVCSELKRVDNQYQDHDPDWLLKELQHVNDKLLVLINDVENRREYIMDEVKPGWITEQELQVRQALDELVREGKVIETSPGFYVLREKWNGIE